MLSSIRSKRLFILASVKFLSRALTALNFDPSRRSLHCTEQIKFAAQRDELATDLTNGPAIVLAKIRNGLEVRRQPAGQPDHLDVALAFPLQTSARRNPPSDAPQLAGGILSRESQQTEYFFTQPGRKPEVAIQVGIELPPSRT
jgi:hypothetical protein